jgi:phenylalanyl-tRNA synthetase beta chain
MQNISPPCEPAMTFCVRASVLHRELPLSATFTVGSLAEALTGVGFPTRPAGDCLEIAIPPDRGYARSLRGITAEIAIAAGVRHRRPRSPVPPDDPAGYPVSVDSPWCNAVSVLRARVGGIDRPPTEEQAGLLEDYRLAAGNRLDAAIAIATYETGQPVHVFAAASLRGPLVVRPAGAGGGDDAVLADDSGVLAPAALPVHPRVGDGADVVLVATCCDPLRTAQTAARLGTAPALARSATWAVDPAVAVAALDRTAGLLGATAVLRSGAGARRRPGRIRMLGALPERIAGVPIPLPTAVRRLEELGCEVAQDENIYLVVLPPAGRPDLRAAVDLAAEVVRLQDHASIAGALPLRPARPGLSRAQRVRRDVARALVQAGYTELVAGSRQSGPTRSLLPRLLDALRSGGTDGRYFAIAPVGASGTATEYAVTAVIADRPGPAWESAVETAVLLGAAAGHQPAVEAGRAADFHPGRCAALRIGERLAGHAGELHPRAVTAAGLTGRVGLVRLDPGVLAAQASAPAS